MILWLDRRINGDRDYEDAANDDIDDWILAHELIK